MPGRAPEWWRFSPIVLFLTTDRSSNALLFVVSKREKYEDSCWIPSWDSNRGIRAGMPTKLELQRVWNCLPKYLWSPRRWLLHRSLRQWMLCEYFSLISSLEWVSSAIVGISSMKKTESAFLKMNVKRMDQSPFLRFPRSVQETKFSRLHVARRGDVPTTFPWFVIVFFQADLVRKCASAPMENFGMIRTKSAWKSPNALKRKNARPDLKRTRPAALRKRAITIPLCALASVINNKILMRQNKFSSWRRMPRNVYLPGSKSVLRQRISNLCLSRWVPKKMRRKWGLERLRNCLSSCLWRARCRFLHWNVHFR